MICLGSMFWCSAIVGLVTRQYEYFVCDIDYNYIDTMWLNE